jgi:hypothetical protein
MKCELESFLVPDVPPGYVACGAASSKAVTRCKTHDWTFQELASLCCPIGRIEEAADKAIEKIRAQVQS